MTRCSYPGYVMFPLTVSPGVNVPPENFTPNQSPNSPFSTIARHTRARGALITTSLMMLSCMRNLLVAHSNTQPSGCVTQTYALQAGENADEIGGAGGFLDEGGSAGGEGFGARRAAHRGHGDD